jgi:hypothetical protein
MEIELNKTYDYFDDGKINESRRMLVKITEIIPFDEIDADTLLKWEEEIENCDWLYAKKTDYFIKGELELSNSNIEKIVFVRTINNGWFSLGWWAGRLDFDGSLAKLLK